MVIGERLRVLREAKGLSQGDIESSTGLLRCYISHVEHGHLVPSLQNLERFAAALDVPLYRLFYNGDGAPPAPHLTSRASLEELSEQGGSAGTEARLLLKLRAFVGKMADADRALLLRVAHKLAIRQGLRG